MADKEHPSVDITTAEIPSLVGESNLAEWDLQVWLAVGDLDAEEYLEKDIPLTTPASKALKRTVYRILTASTVPVQNNLKIAGWKPREIDPYGYYQLIHRVIPRVSGDNWQDLLREFARIDSKNFETLNDYARRLAYLADRLDGVGLELSDRTKVAFALDGLQDFSQYTVWNRELRNDKLSWKELLQRIQAESWLSKRTNPAFVQVSKNNSDSKPRGASRFPYHKTCGSHHPGGDEKCWKLHPELKEWEASKKRA